MALNLWRYVTTLLGARHVPPETAPSIYSRSAEEGQRILAQENTNRRRSGLLESHHIHEICWFLRIYDEISGVPRLTKRAYKVDSTYGRMDVGMALEIPQAQPTRLWTIWGSIELLSTHFTDEMNARLEGAVSFNAAGWVNVNDLPESVMEICQLHGEPTQVSRTPQEARCSAMPDSTLEAKFYHLMGWA